MTWVIAVAGFRSRRRPESHAEQTSIRCGCCTRPIVRGAVYAVVTDAHLKRCADCALAMVRATIVAAWDAKGLSPYARLTGRMVACLWPAQLEAEVARRVGRDTTTTPTDAVPVMDYDGRLRAAIERSRQAA